MNTLEIHRKKMMPPVICGKDKTMQARKTNIMFNRVSMLKNNFFGIVILLMFGLFSNLAHSTDPDICTPSNGVPARINIYFNVMMVPDGGQVASTYVDSQSAVTPGPITCSYEHSQYTIYSFNNSGLANNRATVPPIDIGNGYNMILQIDTTPGYYVGVSTPTRWGIHGNSPEVSATIYPAVKIFSGPVSVGIHDIQVSSQLIGYIGTTGKKMDSYLSLSDLDNLTAVYASGVIRFPPKCTYAPEISSVQMPTHFASDFSAVSAGTPLDTPIRVAGKVTCVGGNTSFDGSDLVHISFIPGTPGDGNYIAGIPDVPEVGIRVLDNAGNPLLVNGSEAIAMETNPDEVAPDEFNGTFDFPLQFQLVSRTGTAPTKFGDYQTTLVILMSID